MADEPFDSAAFLQGRGWIAPQRGPRKPTFSLRWLFVVMAMAAVLFTGVGVVVRSSLFRQEREDYLRSHGARIWLPGYHVDLTRCSPKDTDACLEYLESTPGFTNLVLVRKGQVPPEVLEDFTKRTTIETTFRP